MAEGDPQNIFGRLANKVDAFFQARFYKIGSLVGGRPGLSIGLSLLAVFALASGFSQMKSESRADKLWIPQGTRSQQDEQAYLASFQPSVRVEQMVLESKAAGSGGALSTDFLAAAIALHDQVEGLSFEGDNLTSLCLPVPSNGHPCMVNSILGAWSYNVATLRADADPIATLNSRWSREQLEAWLGGAQFDSSGRVTDAKAMALTYFLNSNRVRQGGGYVDPRGEGWEKELVALLRCDAPTCSGGTCVCGYQSALLQVYPMLQRSFGDAFGQVVRGDVGLINAAFMVMILYLVLNLGGVGHKVKSRALLAFGAIIAIVLGAAAGYGLSMWFGFAYTPIHQVLPFVILGIGVDDAFVIMSALDQTDASMPVRERIAHALKHAGVSIMVTSLTDFVALAISVSSALPALSSFCMYAALAILFLFALQLSLFTAFVTLDAYRVSKGRIDCCFCLPRGCPCCPTVAMEEAAASVERGEPDPNQMCCAPPSHKGGLVGKFLEHSFGPVIVKPPVAAGIIVVFLAFCGVCSWQASKLAVEDTQRNFIPDNSYVTVSLNKQNEYFASAGTSVYLSTHGVDCFASQSALASVGTRLGALDSVQNTAGSLFNSWASKFKQAVASNSVPGVTASSPDGYVTVASQYYSGLSTWLNGAGREHRADVVWVDPADPQRGIEAARIGFELKPMQIMIGTRPSVDADRAVVVMDELRREVDGWTDFTGGHAVVYSREFLTWETYRIIKREMFLSVGLCLAAVFVITLVLIAHPLTALLVFLCVLMTIADILGCLNLIGVAIDSVSVIQLVIAVGFSVDYAAHIGHNFMLQTGTLRERVTATLGNVGTAVLNGGLSTFLATLALGASKSYVFRVLFYSFFFTVFLGMLHGMVLLPAVLSLVGPSSYAGKEGQPPEKEPKGQAAPKVPS